MSTEVCSGAPGRPLEASSPAGADLLVPWPVSPLDHTAGRDATAEEEGRGGASR